MKMLRPSMNFGEQSHMMFGGEFWPPTKLRSSEKMLKSQSNLNKQLLRAAMRGQLKDARIAIDAGADIDCQDFNRQTPLHRASLRNHLDLVDFLLHLKARTNVEDLAGDTASSLANKMGHCTIVGAIHRAAKQIRANRRCATETSHQRCSLYDAEAVISRCLPASIAPTFIETGQVSASHHESVSVLFLDIADYSTMRGNLSPAAVFDMLRRFTHALDALAAHHGVERIDAFDGCYMAATNYSARQPADHAVRLARFALAAVAAAAALPVDPQRPELGCIRLLAGMHSGAVCGRVMGAHGGRKHTLHGAAVNVASRMQSQGAAGAVQCSAASAGLMRAQSEGGGEGLRLTGRSEPLHVKGLGPMPVTGQE